MNIRKHIPNFITSLNLFSGCIGIYFAFQGNFNYAFIAILASAGFDFFDGLAARLLKAYSPMGKELDSLADVVSFGVLPGAIIFSLLSNIGYNEWLPFLGFAIPVFSALRLAKFNIDERQTSSFIGLPTPANAIFWGGLVFSYSEVLSTNIYLIYILLFTFCWLLVAELPMFALKFKNISWKQNKIQYVFIIGCGAILGLFRLDAFALLIGWYLILSVITNLSKAIQRFKI